MTYLVRRSSRRSASSSRRYATLGPAVPAASSTTSPVGPPFPPPLPPPPPSCFSSPRDAGAGSGGVFRCHPLLTARSRPTIWRGDSSSVLGDKTEGREEATNTSQIQSNLILLVKASCVLCMCVWMGRGDSCKAHPTHARTHLLQLPDPGQQRALLLQLALPNLGGMGVGGMGGRGELVGVSRLTDRQTAGRPSTPPPHGNHHHTILESSSFPSSCGVGGCYNPRIFLFFLLLLWGWGLLLPPAFFTCFP